MVNYYIEQDNQIVLFDENLQKLQDTIAFMPQYQGLEIKQTERPIVLSEDGKYYVFADTDEYLQEQAQKEAERLAMLNLTRGDVFRGLLLAKGITKSQIAQMIEAMPVSTEEETLTRELALIDFQDALNFYRGNQLIDTIGLALGITSKQLDKFFDVGNGDDKANAYKYLTNVTFTIDSVPETAEVTINGEVTETVTVPYGTTVEYSVIAEGYYPQYGSIAMYNDKTVEVVLVEEVKEDAPTEDDTTDGAVNEEVASDD